MDHLFSRFGGQSFFPVAYVLWHAWIVESDYRNFIIICAYELKHNSKKSDNRKVDCLKFQSEKCVFSRNWTTFVLPWQNAVNMICSLIDFLYLLLPANGTNYIHQMNRIISRLVLGINITGAQIVGIYWEINFIDAGMIRVKDRRPEGSLQRTCATFEIEYVHALGERENSCATTGESKKYIDKNTTHVVSFAMLYDTT